MENITRGKWSTVAKLIMKHELLLNLVQQCMLNLLDEECKKLCHPKQDFMLFRCSPNDLKAFSFGGLESALHRDAPFLFSLLSTVTNHSALQTCTAAAVLLRGRNDKLPSAFAYHINSILHRYSAKKPVYERLSKLGISTTHNTSVRKRRALEIACGEVTGVGIFEWLQSPPEEVMPGVIAGTTGEAVPDMDPGEACIDVLID